MEVMLAGESFSSVTTMTAGADSFALSSYSEMASRLRAALSERAHGVTYLPSHLVPAQFPDSRAELDRYDVVVLSDIGSNSLLLSPAVHDRSERRANRLDLLSSWVRQGGGLLMIGGYLSFSGIEGKARYDRSPLAEVLPVSCLPDDDRVECPPGCVPVVHIPTHPAIASLPAEWPHLLGWNRTILREESMLLASVGGDPLVAVRQVGNGRSAVFTSDCAPHWAPDAFMQWPGYPTLWHGLVEWLGSALHP